ncbi:hypothetical protein NQ318_020009 [Aromia moschata]|uniref:Kinetochore protein SPC25 n=1 Tax=Aromia moschata TaxID=1265417 RepID=A0AAV8Z8Y2_9CUCU|nr:hypothetical protein NQ318_020009 [Aromia moschata]
MDLNNSSYFVAHTTEDGSEDYSVDWDTFSFQAELEMRQKISREHVQVFELLGQATAPPEDDDNVIRQTQEIKDKISELLDTNQSMVSKYDALVTEQKSVQEMIDKLTSHNKSLLESIKKLEEEEAALQKDYQVQKKALQKGVEMYSKNFDLDVNVVNVSETRYEAFVKFGNVSGSPSVKFIVDRAKREVIDFDASAVLSPNEEEEVKKNFGNLKNLPGLLCALRDILLSKKNDLNKV